MAKLFEIKLKVADDDVISALRVLHRMPWVKDLDADFRQLLPNGQGNRTKRNKPEQLLLPPPARREKKKTAHGGMTGFKLMARLIGNSDKHLTTADLVAAFVADGRSGKSIASTIHRMKNEGLVTLVEGKGYYRTKKLLDRMRNSTFATPTTE